MTMFEVGGNTCNNTFQLAMLNVALQVAAICCSYYFTLTNELRHFISFNDAIILERDEAINVSV